jgi:serine protease
MRPIALTLIPFALCALVGTQLSVAEEDNTGVRTHPSTDADAPVTRLIVKLRSSSQLSIQAAAATNGESALAASAAAAKERVSALATRAKLSMRETHAIGPNMHVMQVTPLAKGEAVRETMARIQADSDVELVAEDRPVYAHAVPNDPRATNQWYLQAAQPAATNAYGAWDTTTGSNSVVIAVIDTGVRFDHPDLAGRILPGYDFVSGEQGGGFKTANDGDGRDADASDPGDWVTSADACGTPSNSSWHGTRVSGIIGAATNNTRGIAGVTWASQILPVRVLGKCGGFNSDVIAGMNWAAGQSVAGVPANPNPAKILNISLGGTGNCDSASANVTSTLASLGVLIVVSAGNEGGPVDSPANCPGATAVAGLRHAGTKVGFSSLGPQVVVSAPGGNCDDTTGASCLFSIDTTSNPGTQQPVPNGEAYTDTISRNIGTSFSAPIVSGIAGLMLAANSNLKQPQLVLRLQEGATKPFPTTSDTGTPPVCHVPTGPADIQAVECSCTTSTCGAGMANANGSVQAALRPIADVVVQGVVAPGASLTLQGGGSTAANGHTVTGYAWTRAGTSISTGPTATVNAPTSGTTTVCLMVTDDAGKQDVAKTVITTTSSTTTPVPAGSTDCASEVTVTATDASAAEGGDTGTFTFTRAGNTTAALTVNIAMSGNATNGGDYQSIAATVSFAAGAATATVTVTPIDNAVVDGSRSATVTIQSGTGYSAGSPATATVTIADNDTPAPPPQSNQGGGGGGFLDPLMLVGLALTVLAMLGRGGHLPLPRRAKHLRQHVSRE